MVNDQQTSLESKDIRTLTINVGPQHPSTHGPMDIVVTIEGETIIGAECKVRYIYIEA